MLLLHYHFIHALKTKEFLDLHLVCKTLLCCNTQNQSPENILTKSTKMGPGMVVHVCIASYTEAQVRRSWSKAISQGREM
jgi:hypothetical protein